jgi:tetrahydromethanopterin S-methyltransferase subunit F
MNSLTLSPTAQAAMDRARKITRAQRSPLVLQRLRVAGLAIGVAGVLVIASARMLAAMLGGA